MIDGTELELELEPSFDSLLTMSPVLGESLSDCLAVVLFLIDAWLLVGAESDDIDGSTEVGEDDELPKDDRIFFA